MGNKLMLWIWVLLLLAPGCGPGSSATPDTGDVPDDHQEEGDALDGTDSGVDVPVDTAGDVDTDGDASTDVNLDADTGTDSSGDVDTDADATTVRTMISLTAGGGQATSTGFNLSLSIGTPQPMGTAQNGSHAIQIGPGRVVNQ